MITLVTAPASGALTSVAKALVELRLTQTTESEDLLELIYKASAACAAWCGRPEGFGRATWTQTERASNRGCILMERDINPVISALTVDGTALTADDYELDGSLLYRLSDDTRIAWSGKVVITYAAGYTLLTDLPHDIERACLITLAAMHGMRGRDPAERSRDDSLVSVAYRPDAVPTEAMQLLQPWRRYHL